MEQTQEPSETNVGAVDPVRLTPRELLIYQAGQAFGATQALRQVAEQLNKLSQTVNSQATLQAQSGQKSLDRALSIDLEKPSRLTVSKLVRRVSKAVGALVGKDDSPEL